MIIYNEPSSFFDFRIGKLGYKKHCDRFILVFNKSGKLYKELCFGFYWRVA